MLADVRFRLFRVPLEAVTHRHILPPKCEILHLHNRLKFRYAPIRRGPTPALTEARDPVYLVTEEEPRHYFLYIKNVKKYSRATSTIASCGIKFFVQWTLGRQWTLFELVRAPREKKLPTSYQCSRSGNSYNDIGVKPCFRIFASLAAKLA